MKDWIYAGVGLTFVIGWIANIVQLFAAWNAGLSVGMLFKLIGVVVFPLGSLLGIIGLF